MKNLRRTAIAWFAMILPCTALSAGFENSAFIVKGGTSNFKDTDTKDSLSGSAVGIELFNLKQAPVFNTILGGGYLSHTRQDVSKGQDALKIADTSFGFAVGIGFTNNVSIYGKLGLSYLETDINNYRSADLGHKVYGLGLNSGVGAMYHLGQLSLGAEFIRSDITQNNSSSIGYLNGTYSNWYLTAGYAF
ncbi:outer membrane beta-barrel protein [Vibrio penaeicida]|uniref:outer membrane beta-barrel protein n=1 Tax=Vibrio penaeicida TaxID=104609 RepID=UPI000CE9F2C0|nr:outer membrane beta-barrel protein [Vibrio penaeicida]